MELSKNFISIAQMISVGDIDAFLCNVFFTQLKKFEEAMIVIDGSRLGEYILVCHNSLRGEGSLVFSSLLPTKVDINVAEVLLGHNEFLQPWKLENDHIPRFHQLNP